MDNANSEYAAERHCCRIEADVEGLTELVNGLNLVFYDLQDRIAKLEGSRTENGKTGPPYRGGTPKERAVLSA